MIDKLLEKIEQLTQTNLMMILYMSENNLLEGMTEYLDENAAKLSNSLVQNKIKDILKKADEQD